MRGLFLCCLFSIALTTKAQITPDNLNSVPTDYTINGTVIDSANGQSLEYASVALLKAKDQTTVNGALTAHNGYFIFDNLQPGFYIVKATLINYRTYTSAVIKLLPTQPTQSIKIILTPNTKVLKGVTINGIQDVYTQEIDKKVYDVSKDITAQSGSAMDVLQNVPSVTTDVQGNINLRGSDNVTVLIDGKPSSMLGSDPNTTLQNIPANAIDKIEVITNPSAKYDAVGMAGIINIITKKNMLEGFNGNVTLGISDGGKYNASANINYRSKLFNAYAGYSYVYNPRYGYGSSLLSEPHNDSISYVDENGTQETVTTTILTKAGIDFFPDQLTTISLGSTYNNSIFTTDQNTQYQFSTSTISGTTNTDGILRDIVNPNNNNGWDNSISLKKDFLKLNEELTADVQYSINHNNPQNTFTDYLLSPENIMLDTTPAIQTNSSPEIIRQYFAQADYVLPVTKMHNFETGIKFNDQNVNNQFYAKDLTDETDIFITPLSLQTDNFNYNQAISAAYATYNTSFHTIDIKAGLRTENTYMNFSDLVTNQNFKQDYTDLFPSLFLSKQITDATQIQLSYSRRINRPSLPDLDPVPNYSDPENIREGNPNLKPEYQNSIELSGLQYLKTGLLSLTFYFHESDNTIQRYKTIDSTGTGIISFVNLNHAYNYGVEALVKTNITHWWDVTLSANAYGNQLDGSNLDAGIISNSFIGNVKLNSMLRFTNTLSGMLQAFYQSPQNTILGHLSYFTSVTAGLKQEFLKKKLSASLACSDIFNTRHFEAEFIGDDFTQSVFRKNESRVLNLTLTYLFGSTDNSNNKKQQQQNLQLQTTPSEDY